MNPSICNAIEEKIVLTFTYQEHRREVEPHAYGTSKKGKDCLRCYQVAGTSESGEVPGWKLMLVDEITGLSSSGASFSRPRDGYKKGDRGMTRIYCEL